MDLKISDDIFQSISDFDSREIVSRVTGLKNGIIRSFLPNAKVGSVVRIVPPGEDEVFAEVVGFDEFDALLMPISNEEGIRAGSKVYLHSNKPTLTVSMDMIGKVLNGYGELLTTGEKFQGEERLVYPGPVAPNLRYPIHEQLDLGVRAINGLLSVGNGQRIGIFSGSGVGKSTLLGMVARNVKADVNVICLVGERGRELREFIEKDLGPQGLARSVVVIATSEACAVERLRSSYTAMTIAEYYRDQGLNVMFMMDSITRMAMANREIRLKLGEPTTMKGYTPSVFSDLPKIIERCGTYEGRGTITGIFTVLVEGDDFDEPIADTTRGLLDGHIVLTRGMAQRGIYPAIDATQSISRIMNNIVDEMHRECARKFRELMATLKDNEDLVRIGAYKAGNDSVLDEAMAKKELLEYYVRQQIDQSISFEEAKHQLIRIIRS